MENNGYLYIAAGEKYINEAVDSAISLKNSNENANISIICNEQKDIKAFDNVIINEIDGKNKFDFFRYKASNIKNTPYENTVFIDTDTFICDNCDELFRLLKYHDICVSYSPADNSNVLINEKEILNGYMPYNTGVIVFKKNQKVMDFLECWEKIYISRINEYDYNDQRSFMEALIFSDISVYCLHNIYNARINHIIGIIPEYVKIIHGRSTNYEEVKKSINKIRDNRVWIPAINNCIYKSKHYSKIQNFLFSKLFNE